LLSIIFIIARLLHAGYWKDDAEHAAQVKTLAAFSAWWGLYTLHAVGP
jgi:hypothetical protein